MSRLSSPSEWVAPLVPIASLAVLPLGPIFFPRTYLIVLFMYFSVFLYSQMNHVCKFWMTSKKIQNTVKKKREEDGELEPFYEHVFIIPNYCEPEELLKDTIHRIASHRYACSHYGLILAMEQSEIGWETKARRLQSYFIDQFKDIVITGHPSDIPGESRGKGSNVAFAAQHGCRALIENGMRGDRIMITVTDSDSMIPALYIEEVEARLAESEHPSYLVCAPPIFFSRNCFDVPAAVRVTDITWSAMVMSNLSNSHGLCIPCSNYTLSMNLADEVGYWDTDADAVGEDMHMWLKCFWKTKGEARTAPIYVPINLTNVQTTGYLSNVNARYIQAKRHYNGVADVAYTLKNAVRCSSVTWYERIKVCLIILEAHMIPATSGWLMFAAVPLMQLILFPPVSSLALVSPHNNPILVSDFYAHLWTLIKIITMCLPLPLVATLSIYEHLHRAMDRDFFHQKETRTWAHLLDYVNLPIAAWLFMTLPSTLACVKRLLNRQEKYITSEKLLFNDNLILESTI
ncbi:glycosyl transferase family group 2-domain-containing protein [Pilobolus umbonatus]|nr:glycosyl transferase family group 2-domain-containing protein [Pilobolus umbonatus]